MIQLWRETPACEGQKITIPSIPASCVFPSGRQALTAVLEKAELGRADRIALPEWSSHCVISATGKIVTPVPLQEVIDYNVPVSAVLLYEQWGWPFSDAVHLQIAERFKDTVILLDCVDSADVEQENRLNHYRDGDKVFVVYSLSKLLGLAGGGVVKTVPDYLHCTAKESAKELDDAICSLKGKTSTYPELAHFHKNDIKCLHRDVYDWLKTNDIEECLLAEAGRRRANLKVLVNSSLAQNWPEWMHDIIDSGAAPGIVPLGYNVPLQTLHKYRRYLSEKFYISTAIYNFNWSGNPLKTEYDPCLAFPVHGDVGPQLLQDIVDDSQRM